MKTKTYKQSLKTRRVYKIDGMDCDACAKMIELDLEDAGFSAKCDYAKELLEVNLKETSDEEKIKEIIKNSGYSLVE